MWRLCALFFIIAAASVAHAADLGVPRLNDTITARKYFDPARLLTSGGVKYEAGRDLVIEPRFGLGHGAWERETKSGHDEMIHKVHAEAGGKIDLSDSLHLSAAAKLPIYTYGSADTILGQNVATRHSYDFLQLPGDNLTWTGEMGIRLGKKVDLNLYYDQSLLDSFQGGSSPSQPEDRFGTRIIIRFK